MDHHVKEFFSESSDETPRGNFHKVISLHDSPELDWKTASKMCPKLCKGWFELAHLNTKDRIEFLRDYWLDKMPYHPPFGDYLIKFFGSLEDIGVFLTQQKFEDPFEACLVYNLKGDKGYFRGASGASEEDIVNMQRLFPDTIFPQDYIAFLRIHNGFSKTTDCTGITKSTKMEEQYQKLQQILAKQEPHSGDSEDQIDPKSLIPFYESFGMPFFQCFWTEWYPQDEMGNVYYSTQSNRISSIKKLGGEENMSFPTFSDWLMFYMKGIEEV